VARPLVNALELAASLAAIPIALTAHEAGHMIGGKIGGLCLALFVVGPRDGEGGTRCRLPAW